MMIENQSKLVETATGMLGKTSAAGLHVRAVQWTAPTDNAEQVFDWIASWQQPQQQSKMTALVFFTIPVRIFSSWISLLFYPLIEFNRIEFDSFFFTLKLEKLDFFGIAKVKIWPKNPKFLQKNGYWPINCCNCSKLLLNCSKTAPIFSSWISLLFSPLIEFNRIEFDSFFLP